MQKIIASDNFDKSIDSVLKSLNAKRYMLVCDSSFPYLSINKFFDTEIRFNEFSPNPLYEQVCQGVEMFNSNKCDAIVAVGGGSTIDVAKCIKLFCKMDVSKNYLQQEFRDSGVPLAAVPTTAGTGSESTRYAVIYFEGKKQSITHESIIPDYAVLEPSVLKTLPLYQKKCTLLDALCQGIESWWSVNSTSESIQYSKECIETIAENMNDYIFGESETAAQKIMTAANLSGRAINITQTTAAHAMSYKLTSKYGAPHGYAVALCLPVVWKSMTENFENCVDTRGEKYLSSIFTDIAESLGCNTANEAISFFERTVDSFGMTHPTAEENDLTELSESVNPVRLKNNPVAFGKDEIYRMYERILHK